MFVDASAIVAILSGEPEAAHFETALDNAASPITSPVAVFEAVLALARKGTVQQLGVHTVGGVVTPAQPLMTIVPDIAPVLIEANVSNDDVGFVHAGQDAEIKVATFTFTRYGLLHGRVVDVSRDVAAATTPRAGTSNGNGDQDGTSDDPEDGNRPSRGAYVAHVALVSDTLDVDGIPTKLEPGMNINAEIKTGRRTVISYLLSPLQKHLAETGEER